LFAERIECRTQAGRVWRRGRIPIPGGSSMGASSQRQKRESSIFSQALQEPMAASANTPRVGKLTRAGWMVVVGA
jgi:hypothetical protein